MRSGTFFLHIIFFLVTIGVMGCLLWLNVAPSGDVVFVQDFERRSSFVSDLWPPESLRALENGARPFTKDEVTFFVRPPRLFERVQMVIVFRSIPQGLVPKLLVQTSIPQNTWQEIEWQYQAPGLPGKNSYYQATLQLDPHWRSSSKRYNMKIRVAGLEKQKNPAIVEEISARFLDPVARIGNFWRLLRE